jgi:hypothetical protein
VYRLLIRVSMCYQPSSGRLHKPRQQRLGSSSWMGEYSTPRMLGLGRPERPWELTIDIHGCQVGWTYVLPIGRQSQISEIDARRPRSAATPTGTNSARLLAGSEAETAARGLAPMT